MAAVFRRLVPAGGHDLDGEWRILERGVRLAVPDLAGALTLGRQEDLEPSQTVQFARQCVQGLEVTSLRDGLTGAPGVQGQAELYDRRKHRGQ